MVVLALDSCKVTSAIEIAGIRVEETHGVSMTQYSAVTGTADVGVRQFPERRVVLILKVKIVVAIFIKALGLVQKATTNNVKEQKFVVRVDFLSFRASLLGGHHLEPRALRASLFKAQHGAQAILKGVVLGAQVLVRALVDELIGMVRTQTIGNGAKITTNLNNLAINNFTTGQLREQRLIPFVFELERLE